MKFAGDKNKWFEVDNYIHFVTDHMRNVIKNAIRNYDIQSFYASSIDIIRAEVLDEEVGVHTYEENGAVITDVEVIGMSVESPYAEMLDAHQEELLSKRLELADADAKMQVVTALAEVEKKEADLEATNKIYKLELEQQVKMDKLAKEEALKVKLRAAQEAENKAKADMQALLASINDAEIAREKAKKNAEIEYQKQLEEIEYEKQVAYADTVKTILGAIQPGLVEALQGQTNAALANGIGQAVAPYAIANGKDISEVVSTMLRGTTLDSVLATMQK